MLIPVKSYQLVAQEVNAILLQGGPTNGLPDRDSLEKEICQGTLFLQSEDRGAILLRRREHWDRLTFFLKGGQTFRGWQPQRSTLVELPFRSETDPMREVAQSLEDMGFSQLLKRIRYTRKGKESTFTEISEGSLEESYGLLCNSFSAVTGCIPPLEEWERLCNDGQVLSVRGGLLHYEQKGRTTELRHLAVAEDCRRQGIGRSLVGAYLNRCGTGLSRVWTGEDNIAAQRLYESFGYEKDGWTSRVLYYDMNKKDE